LLQEFIGNWVCETWFSFIQIWHFYCTVSRGLVFFTGHSVKSPRGRMFAGKLSAEGNFSGERSYNGTSGNTRPSGASNGSIPDADAGDEASQLGDAARPITDRYNEPTQPTVSRQSSVQTPTQHCRVDVATAQWNYHSTQSVTQR